MERREILGRLLETDPRSLEDLWSRADAVRAEHVGDEVHLRGLVEFSNHCRRSCAYCGLRAPNRNLERYRMTDGEILECARRAESLDYGTVVLQSGEDAELDPEWLAGVVRRIKAATGLAVTLSVGERPRDDLALWREAGADRYLLRFETSNPDLYARIHPALGDRADAGMRLPEGADETSQLLRKTMLEAWKPGQGCRACKNRLGYLRILRELGYEVGSGVMVGLPGQAWEDLANDLLVFHELDLDMIGIGPYVPHPETPLFEMGEFPWAPAGKQTPGDLLTACKMIALARILCPRANIPSTTAVATVERRWGHETALGRGANVVMPNLTPPKYRSLYDIYPERAGLPADEQEGAEGIVRRIQAMGRTVGRGRGDSPNWNKRMGRVP